MHAEVGSVCNTVVVAVAVIVPMHSVTVPGMASTIGYIEMRTTEIEVVTMGVA
jgi:hypothetical protein